MSFVSFSFKYGCWIQKRDIVWIKEQNLPKINFFTSAFQKNLTVSKAINFKIAILAKSCWRVGSKSPHKHHKRLRKAVRSCSSSAHLTTLATDHIVLQGVQMKILKVSAALNDWCPCFSKHANEGPVDSPLEIGSILAQQSLEWSLTNHWLAGLCLHHRLWHWDLAAGDRSLPSWRAQSQVGLLEILYWGRTSLQGADNLHEWVQVIWNRIIAVLQAWPSQEPYIWTWQLSVACSTLQTNLTHALVETEQTCTPEHLHIDPCRHHICQAPSEDHYAFSIEHLFWESWCFGYKTLPLPPNVKSIFPTQS